MKLNLTKAATLFVVGASLLLIVLQVHDSVRPGGTNLDVTQAIGQAIRRENLQNVQEETKADVRHRATGGVSSNPFEYAKLRNFTTFAQEQGASFRSAMKSHLWVQSLESKKTVCHDLSDAGLETSFSELVEQIEPEGSTASGVVTPMGTCFAVLQTASENDCREICRLSRSAENQDVKNCVSWIYEGRTFDDNYGNCYLMESVDQLCIIPEDVNVSTTEHRLYTGVVSETANVQYQVECQRYPHTAVSLDQSLVVIDRWIRFVQGKNSLASDQSAHPTLERSPSASQTKSSVNSAESEILEVVFYTLPTPSIEMWSNLPWNSSVVDVHRLACDFGHDAAVVPAAVFPSDKSHETEGKCRPRMWGTAVRCGSERCWLTGYERRALERTLGINGKPCGCGAYTIRCPIPIELQDSVRRDERVNVALVDLTRQYQSQLVGTFTVCTGYEWNPEEMLGWSDWKPETDQQARNAKLREVFDLSSVPPPRTGLLLNDSLQQRHRISMCTNPDSHPFRIQGPRFFEWMEYHRSIGVEHFYVYLHHDTVNNTLSLMPYIEAGLVTLVPWRFNRFAQYKLLGAMHAPSPHMTMKEASMNHCMWRFGHDNDWLIFTDFDEYLQSRTEASGFNRSSAGHDLTDFLQNYDSQDVCAVTAFGPLFTSLPQWDESRAFQQSPLDLEIYTASSTDANSATKTIYHIPTFNSLAGVHNPHICHGQSGKAAVKADPKKLRIVHYRADANGGTKNMGSVQDKSMIIYADYVRDRIASLETYVKDHIQ